MNTRAPRCGLQLLQGALPRRLTDYDGRQLPGEVTYGVVAFPGLQRNHDVSPRDRWS